MCLQGVKEDCYDPEMKRLLASKDRWFILVTGLAVFFGVLARAYRLGYPDKPVFDEVYFPVFAKNMLHGVMTFDVHPPLGKMLIAIGIWLFGDTGFGWRVIPFVVGLLTIGLFFGLGYLYFKNRLHALLLTCFIALEGILIVYSRTGLMDGILFFAIMLCFALAVRAKNNLQITQLAAAIGLAIAIKWLALAVVVPVAYVMWRKGYLRRFVATLPVAAIVYFFVVYTGEVIGGAANPVREVLVWHHEAWQYQTTLTATHPWSSVWWTWPLMSRPVLMWYQVVQDGKIEIITALGNPLIWWSSSLATFGSVFYLAWQWLVKHRSILDHPLMPLLVGYFAFFLPWVPVHRVLFIYHYLPAYGFALMILAYWLGLVGKRKPWIAVTFLVMALALAIFFAPLATTFPISQANLNAHLWIKDFSIHGVHWAGWL